MNIHASDYLDTVLYMYRETADRYYKSRSMEREKEKCDDLESRVVAESPYVEV